jgi:hypothetical protein
VAGGEYRFASTKASSIGLYKHEASGVSAHVAVLVPRVPLTLSAIVRPAQPVSEAHRGPGRAFDLG